MNQPDHSMEQTRASRFDLREFVSAWRLTRAAHADPSLNCVRPSVPVSRQQMERLQHAVGILPERWPERGSWRAALDRKRGTFAIGYGKPARQLAAPQSYQEPEFPFP